jgi:hypothetical protein
LLPVKSCGSWISPVRSLEGETFTTETLGHGAFDRAVVLM